MSLNLKKMNKVNSNFLYKINFIFKQFFDTYEALPVKCPRLKFKREIASFRSDLKYLKGGSRKKISWIIIRDFFVNFPIVVNVFQNFQDLTVKF